MNNDQYISNIYLIYNKAPLWGQAKKCAILNLGAWHSIGFIWFVSAHSFHMYNSLSHVSHFAALQGCAVSMCSHAVFEFLVRMCINTTQAFCSMKKHLNSYINISKCTSGNTIKRSYWQNVLKIQKISTYYVEKWILWLTYCILHC